MEVARSLPFMQRVMEDVTDDASVVAVAEKEVAAAEEDEVDVAGVAARALSPTLPSDLTLIKNGRVSATMRRARSSIFAINQTRRARSMQSISLRILSLRLPRLRPHRTLVRQPQGRKRAPVI